MATASTAPYPGVEPPAFWDEGAIARVKDFYNRLKFIDLSPVQAKAYATDAGVKDYKKFLALRAGLSKLELSCDMSIFSPSDDMDALWHAHILDTQAYRECCELLLGKGKFIDHNPHGGDNPRVRKQRRTFTMWAFKTAFGADPEQGWGPDPCSNNEGDQRPPKRARPTSTGGLVEIFVKSLDDVTTTVKVTDSWMVEDLKDAITRLRGTPMRTSSESKH